MPFKLNKTLAMSGRWGLLIIVLLIISLFIRPRGFDDPYSTVIEDREGRLLGAMIADDGQWRFPSPDSISERIKKCIVLFEDQYFENHPGVDVFALARAAYLNIKHRKIVSGGSTISMQVIRLMRKGQARSISEKIREIFLAFRLEMMYSKDEILNMYLSHAPFGGNVVGLEAGSWRYFSCSPGELTWADAACLAVLPNAPSMIHPGRNREVLLEKRNALLDRLLEKQEIDSITWELSKQEPLPGKPKALPQMAPHLLDRLHASHRGERLRTTIDRHLQSSSQMIVNDHLKALKENEIHNASALILEVETGKVLAYVGNTTLPGDQHGEMVDIITAPRSSGSVFKPLLYAALLDEGRILPKTLIPDIPTRMTGFSPKNFNDTYDGAVYADRALSRSLNIPAVNMLGDYGVDRFQAFMNELGMNEVNRPPGTYGLSLILGGAETSLWELAGTYASMSRILNHFYGQSGKYNSRDFHTPVFIANGEKSQIIYDEPVLGAASIWLTYKAMEEVNRPEREESWEAFSSSRRIAWKTGTSFGFRDAWSVGTDPDYVVAVWAGNADGEGRPGLTGVSAAAPMLFDLFDLLPQTDWFETPWDEMQKIAVCKQSGHRMGKDCETADSMWVQLAGLHSSPCPYHQIIHLDPGGRYRVTEDCTELSEMRHEPWFILPPAMAWYFKDRHSWYKEIPAYKPGCDLSDITRAMDFIYPDWNAQIYIPTGLDGIPGEAILEIAHRVPETSIYWHLDEEYLGKTMNRHQMGIRADKGEHIVTAVDERGEMISVKFVVVSTK